MREDLSYPDKQGEKRQHVCIYKKGGKYEMREAQRDDCQKLPTRLVQKTPTQPLAVTCTRGEEQEPGEKKHKPGKPGRLILTRLGWQARRGRGKEAGEEFPERLAARKRRTHYEGKTSSRVPKKKRDLSKKKTTE